MTLPGHAGQSLGDRQVLPEDSGGIQRAGHRVHMFRATGKNQTGDFKMQIFASGSGFASLAPSRRDVVGAGTARRDTEGNVKRGERQWTWCWTRGNQLSNKAKQRGRGNKGLPSNWGLGPPPGTSPRTIALLRRGCKGQRGDKTAKPAPRADPKPQPLPLSPRPPPFPSRPAPPYQRRALRPDQTAAPAAAARGD